MNIEVVSGRDRLNRVLVAGKKRTVVIARQNDCETN